MNIKKLLIFIRELLNKPTINLNFIGLLFIFNFLLSVNLFSQVGILTDTPHSSAALDIDANNKGLLIPRIILTNDINSSSPISSPATGLLIFNNGSNQPTGFYYWNGSKWVSTSFSVDNWSITGNSSTSVNNNFLGTTDNQHFGIRTNNSERLRIESDGQILIGLTTTNNDADLFTVEGNATHYSAINAYSPNGYGVYSTAGSIGFLGIVDGQDAFGLRVENNNADGYGSIFVGSDAPAYTLNNHSMGISSSGDDGIFCLGSGSNGIGIISGGNGLTTVSTVSEGSGGAFTGHHGVYGNASNNSGVGVVGVGNNGDTYNTNSDGSGGAFTGYHGIYSYATSSSNGTGTIGVGNDGSYYLMSNGGGGAFTGTYYGIAAWSTQSGGAAVFGNAVNGGWAVYSQGNFGATGTKSFVIDHPLEPEDKILKHYCVESPEVLNMYRGITKLNQDGEAIIILPDYFTAININYSYVITAIGQPAPNIFIKEEINDQGEFKISGGATNQKISWVVYAERNDLYLQQNPDSREVVVEKREENKGKYLVPELFGQPKEKGIFYSNKTTGAINSHKAIKTKLITVPAIKKDNKTNKQ